MKIFQYGKNGMIDFLFVSPHLKKIGETYVLPRICKYSSNKETSFALFNVAGEWDHLRNLSEYMVLENNFRWIVSLAPDIEKLHPWLNYRIWLFFTSISIFFGLINLISKKEIKFVIARMATSAAGACSKMTTKTKFIVSMAGVPKDSILRSMTWPWLYKNFYKVVVPCASMKEKIKDLSKREDKDILVCTNAVIDESFIPSDFGPKKNLETCNLIFVGRLTRQKGLDTLIRSLRYLDENFNLFIYGDGEEEKALKSLVGNLRLESQVKFCGRKNNPWEKIDSFHIYVMPSRWEGPGHTIIEALSHGIPSIVSNCPYGPEETMNYGEFGYIFDTDDKKSLAAAIRSTWQNYNLSLEKAKLGQSFTYKYKPSSIYSFWSKILDER